MFFQRHHLLLKLIVLLFCSLLCKTSSSQPPFLSPPSVSAFRPRTGLDIFFNTTNGISWLISHDWNSASVSICDRFGISCREQEQEHRNEAVVFSLILPDNNLSGSIPEQLFEMLPAMQVLDLSENHSLQGTLPSSISLLAQLRVLRLQNCNLSGRLPRQLFQLPLIREIDIRANFFSGTIPPDVVLPSLTVLRLSSNHIGGTIPPSLCLSALLDTIDVSNNRIRGSIPDEIGYLSLLQRLDLSFNQIVGSVPGGVFEVPFMSFVDVSHNQLSGFIPSDTRGAHCISAGDIR
eukprot:c9704_g1_i2.p1 GENE.c9704_g1_i2~~c9704_g1_i2.p1  ORF type:complete len:292 (+),score=53.89 c9704_g1_i2:166-1041(+)